MCKEILFSHQKDEMLSFVTTWLNLEGMMLSEVGKYHMISCICVIQVEWKLPAAGGERWAKVWETLIMSTKLLIE